MAEPKKPEAQTIQPPKRQLPQERPAGVHAAEPKLLRNQQIRRLKQ